MIEIPTEGYLRGIGTVDGLRLATLLRIPIASLAFDTIREHLLTARRIFDPEEYEHATLEEALSFYELLGLTTAPADSEEPLDYILAILDFYLIPVIADETGNLLIDETGKQIASQ